MTTCSEILSLGYMGVGAADLDPWEAFASRLLGLQCHDRSSSSLGLRMDERHQRFLIDRSVPEGRHYYGWEVADAGALLALAGRVEASGVSVKQESRALADQRGVTDLVSFTDPAGNRLELFYGPLTAASPFTPSRPLTGFRTGKLGLGHAVLNVIDAGPMLDFYTKVLGFRMSDYMLKPFRAFFLHVNARHHSLALIEGPANGVHHILLELLSLDDVGQAYDLALEEESRIGVTLGRHSNDFMTSFYARTPSNFMVEYGWGGREIDTATWKANELCHGPSLWGHERYWLPPDKRQQAREMRLKAAAEGVHAPVQVLEGYHVLMSSS